LETAGSNPTGFDLNQVGNHKNPQLIHDSAKLIIVTPFTYTFSFYQAQISPIAINISEHAMAMDGFDCWHGFAFFDPSVSCWMSLIVLIIWQTMFCQL